MSHTKGPWKWWTSCSWRRLLNEDGSKHILQPTNHRIDHHPDIIVTDADMRLIEAAPELLEECKMAIIALGHISGRNVGVIVSRLSYVVAKAEGRK